MIQLDAFEGITGYRWAAHLSMHEGVVFSKAAPAVHDRKIALIEQVLANAPFEMTSADLVFGTGKILLRRGSWGMLLLFCEPDVNVPMVDIVISELKDGPPTSAPTSPSGTSTGTRLSLIHNLSDSSAPIPGDVIAELMDLFVEFLGPFARRIAEKDLGEAGIDIRQIPSKKWPEVLNILAARFNDDAKRDHFLDRAVLLKTKF